MLTACIWFVCREKERKSYLNLIRRKKEDPSFEANLALKTNFVVLRVIYTRRSTRAIDRAHLGKRTIKEKKRQTCE